MIRLCIFTLFLIGCSPDYSHVDPLLASSFEHKMISSGDNFPAVNLRKNHREQILLIASEGVNRSDIHTFLPNSTDIEDQIELLINNDFLTEIDGKLYSTVYILTDTTARYWREYIAPVVDETVNLIKTNLDFFKGQYTRINSFKKDPFERHSLFILSNVLLDNYQINTIEEKFLGVERTQRHGKKYFYSLQEKVNLDSHFDALRIYGNQIKSTGFIFLGLYGNQHNKQTLLNLNADDIRSNFDVKSNSYDIMVQELIQKSLAGKSSKKDIQSLIKFGAIDSETDRIIQFTDEENQALRKLARGFYDPFEKILKKYRSPIFDLHFKGPQKGVTFEEFYMWWYHIFYSEVTDKLIAEGLITLPKSGNYFYVIKKTPILK